jgi:hypothetical protein
LKIRKRLFNAQENKEDCVSLKSRGISGRLTDIRNCFTHQRALVGETRFRRQAAGNDEKSTEERFKLSSRDDPFAHCVWTSLLISIVSGDLSPGTRFHNQRARWWRKHFLRSARRPENPRIFRRAQAFLSMKRREADFYRKNIGSIEPAG